MKRSLNILYFLSALVFAMTGCHEPDGQNNGDVSDDIILTVAADGSGDYKTVQSAFDAIPAGSGARHVVYVRNGTYHEKPTLQKGRDNVVLIGEDAMATIITYDDYAGKETSEGSGEELGTSRSQTLAVESDDFMAVNITIRNTFINTDAAAAVNKGTQGVALKITGDRAALYNCRLTGYQDTFLGWNTGRIYLRECYIEGNVDFIFGNSVMVFDRCTTYVNREGSVLTAAATPEGMKFGFVFLDCDLQTMPAGSKDFNGRTFSAFHLGRPWQAAPQTVFIRCHEPATLHPDGWRPMSVEAALYGEYGCTGEGAAADRLESRKMGGRQLSGQEAAGYTIENIFSRRTWQGYKQDWLPPAKYELPE